jgi:GPI-anchor transamidase subunit K
VINIIKGFIKPNQAASQKLMTNENSDILFYFTGHSGEEFFKVQDSQVLYSRDIGNALTLAYKKKKYRRILFISDTCEAFSWFSYVQAPNVMYQASSGLGENALSHEFDPSLNTFLSDKYSFELMKFLSSDRYFKNFKDMSILNFFEMFDKRILESTPVFNSTLVNSTLGTEKLIDFWPTPFTKNSVRSEMAQKYSIFERIKHSTSLGELQAAGDFIKQLKRSKSG